MARDVGRDQPTLGLMDIHVERNAFGRQLQSFEISLDLPNLFASTNGHTAAFHAIFIRAPIISHAGPEVEILARLPEGTIVAAE